jgi:iron(III) transport system ATP-binding protein
MSAIRVDAASKRFGRTEVLAGVDLRVPAGALAAILGASGSGKTTLLRLIAGFTRLDTGTIAIGGRTLDDGHTVVRPQHRGVGYVPQDGALFPHLTVIANVAFGLARAERGRARELLDLVGLADLARRYPHQLSGGQQQRVALARALAIRPAVVLLDEPFSSLDAALRVELRQDVARILRESSTTALLVTHDQDEALSLADLVAVLKDGKIVQCAAPHELYARPVDDRVARFLGDANILGGVFAGTLVDTALGQLSTHWNREPPAKGAPVNVLIRPEQIDLHDATSEQGLAGQVTRSRYHGHDTVLHVQVDQEHAERDLIVRAAPDTSLPPGTNVKLSARGPVLVWPVSGCALDQRSAMPEEGLEPPTLGL